MRYWWVNHKQTSRHELSGGYLWSPKRELKARSQFYDNMRLVEPGDIVLSYSGGMMRHTGVALDYASTALKPEQFGPVGDYWSSEGWLLPVSWHLLDNPIRPKDQLRELGPLLPEKYSPIQAQSGHGNQKAYLAEIDRSVVDLLLGPDAVLAPAEAPASSPAIDQAEDAVEARITADTGLEATVRQQLVLARHGQGIFRSRLLEFETECRLTGVVNPRLLVASHMKPWRVCATGDERLDGANGLLLTPHVDRLFDRGFIGFEADGQVLLSARLDAGDLHRLGLDEACQRTGRPFKARQQPYLAYHRANVLLA
jgi:hypothetical protein